MDRLSRRNFLSLGKNAAWFLGTGAALSACTSKASDKDLQERAKSAGQKVLYALPSGNSTADSLRLSAALHAAELLQIELKVYEHNYDMPALVNYLDEELEKGYSALIVSGVDEDSFMSCLQLTEKEESRLYLLGAYPESAHDTFAAASNYTCFAGSIAEDEEAIADRVVKELCEKRGLQHVGLVSWSLDDMKSKARIEAIQTSAERYKNQHPEPELKLEEAAYATNSSEAAELVERMLDSYPTLDAIYVAGDGGEQLHGVLAQLKNASREAGICVASAEINSDMAERLVEDLPTVATTVAYYDCALALLLVSRADTGASWNVTLHTKAISTKDELEAYSKSSFAALPLSDADFLNLLKMDRTTLEAKLETRL